jgi:aminomethyltransferase
MDQPPAGQLKQSPLHARHQALGVRWVPSAGWEMPAEFAGAAEEHAAVRHAAGLFDLSHMGQIEMAGRDALAALQWLTCNDAGSLDHGQTQRSGLLTPDGTFVDDAFVNRLGDSHFLLVVGAATVAKDVAWITAQSSRFSLAILDTSARYAALALHGPAAHEVLQPLANFDLSTIQGSWFAHGEIAGVRATVFRTGALGEDGFEVFTPPQMAARAWDAILAAGRESGVMPAGVAAWDTLRLEAGQSVFGLELDETTTVIEAGLRSLVAWRKGEFLGRAALEAQRATGAARSLVGFEMVDAIPAAHGDPLIAGGVPAGVVTSGALSPFLKKAIGLAYVPTRFAAPGTELDVDVRGRIHRARVVPLPFYKRARG